MSAHIDGDVGDGDTVDVDWTTEVVESVRINTFTKQIWKLINTVLMI